MDDSRKTKRSVTSRLYSVPLNFHQVTSPIVTSEVVTLIRPQTSLRDETVEDDNPSSDSEELRGKRVNISPLQIMEYLNTQSFLVYNFWQTNCVTDYVSFLIYLPR